ncbi:glutamine-hydrolyzing GMP synthase [Candidatus Cloacimonadota bacterium]
MNKVAIIDFGGQYTHLIARRIRNLGVYSEIVQPEDLQQHNDYQGIIFSGGPQSVNEADAYRIDLDLQQNKIPILGICYGHQVLAAMLGGTIESGENKEYGFTEIFCANDGHLFSGLEEEQTVWMSHGDHVTLLPEGFTITANSKSIAIASYQSNDLKYFGTQFHPEVTHTSNGLRMLDNFISQCVEVRDWDPQNYKDSIISEIRKSAEGKKLVLLLSGGVDSLVALELCIRAVGPERVFSIHVDTGFMRKNESSEIMKHFEELGFHNIKIIEAEDLYLKELEGITDPETKRLIIGKLFVDIANRELSVLEKESDVMLVQGTIYPDTIESGSTDKAAKIKTHHNRVSEIEKLISEGRIIEPIKELYKDEVRRLGEELELPYNLVHRHPFPGPGLAIRVICSNGSASDSDHLSEEVDFEELLNGAGLKGQILPIKSVGVQGDFRTYHHPAVIWFEDYKNFSWKVLNRIASTIINKLSSINRLIFSPYPVDLELKEQFLTRNVLDKLREVDHILRQETDHVEKIWQMPVVALPLWQQNRQAFVIRPVCSTDAMTASVYEIDPQEFLRLNDMTEKLSGVGPLLLDITTKPPGTIEWE